MKLNLALAGLSALAMFTSTSLPAFARDEPVAVVQVGDSALSCKALAAEINGLTQAQAQKAKQAQQTRGFMSFATGALQAASPYVGGFGGGNNSSALIGSLAAQGAMAAASGAQAQAQPSADQTPEAARLQRLNGLFAEKNC